MVRSITVSDQEPAHDWLNKLAREAEDDRLFPEEYEFSDVEQLAIQMSEDTLARKAELYSETKLSEREAEVVALKEGGLTHRGIALVMSLTGDDFEAQNEPSSSGTGVHVWPSDGNVSPSTVDEYVRRAREKYLDAAYTYEHLDGVFFTSKNWECPGCEQLFDLTEYVAPPMECPNCHSEHFLAKGKPK